MYVKVKMMDGSQTAVLTISKLTSLIDFRSMVNEKLKVAPERQRLFFRGKQMEDGYTMYDYGININDVIQLMPKAVLGEINTNTPSKTDKAEKKKSEPTKDDSNEEKNETKPKEVIKRDSRHYRSGDLVDAKYGDGSWWEAKVVDITVDEDVTETTYHDDGVKYHIKYERYEEDEALQVYLDSIRPRAHKRVQLEDANPGDTIMVNYNRDEPEKRGHWYDCKVKKVFLSKSKREIIGSIHLDDDKPIDNCKIIFVNELFTINKHIRLAVRDGVPETEIIDDAPVGDDAASPNCKKCKDNKGRKCKDCGCLKCGGKENPDKQLMCDECDQPFHLYCLDPPMDALPDVDEWFCPLCKNDETSIVRMGEGLKHSKKRSNMPSSKGTGRDWGKGFACAGRQKKCSVVPINHFGPIPGVEVGTSWKFRINVSESGVHRPPVAGIAGKEKEGAQSVVLAGGYEDDKDDGDEFTYTGSGGRDLSGNKRTAEQSMDQELTRMNKALALNVNARLNKDGAEAEDWKGGKPVRVIRNCKGRKHSNYAPEEGNRYDGIYKIVKYWPETGKSGFKVWRYLFRRDDDANPAPWTKKGKKLIEELGLEMIYPEGYLEAQAEKEKEKEREREGSDSESDEEDSKKKKRKNKRKSKGGDTQSEPEDDENKSPPAKKAKKSGYKLDKELADMIEKDTENLKNWEDCKESLKEGKVKFMAAVEEQFLCICCQEIPYLPITTPCTHNHCQSCLQRSFSAKVYSCPACRHDLGEKYKITVNKTLQSALVALFPGYEVGR